ncbi:hypothetical protein QCA50_014093 [Cerrena zonata]|uniref:Uncharacterized protein n=1 Tax=Cerrena zonata TaxID=2478898 RepID=A0AAW0FN24_9APHY
MKYPADDVALSDGHGYMVGKAKFERYIDSAPTLQLTKSTCHEHDAELLRVDRHGCFYPHAVVNFRKGEGQRYMDYAIVCALNYIGSLIALVLYDIVCQWFINFFRRVGECCDFLSLPDNLNIIPGIGLFHVHGHKHECYPRYAPSFIPGAGMVDGEIIETLWNLLNFVASSARAMTWFGRQEYIDVHMGNSNWMKFIRIVESILRKWHICVVQVEESKIRFLQISQSLTQAQIALWTAEEKRMQRLRGEKVDVMDGYDVHDARAPTKAEIQLKLADRELSGFLPSGCIGWLSMGIHLEEVQLELSQFVRKLGTHPTITQKLALQQRRAKLRSQIDDFVRSAPNYLRVTQQVPRSNIEDWQDLDDEDLYELHPIESTAMNIPQFEESVLAETLVIPLPSSFGSEVCHNELSDIAVLERKLRKGQANDALYNLRVAIAHKSFLHRTRLRNNAPTTSYSKRLRSYGDVAAVQHSVEHSAKAYRLARKAMIVLGASEQHLQKYQTLSKEDLKASTAIADSNAPGQRSETLSWIWYISLTSRSTQPAFMEELFRVNWLRAKARRDRWAEEKILLKSELSWTKAYFQRRSDDWKSRITARSPGLACYAHLQKRHWDLFVLQASTAQQVVC